MRKIKSRFVFHEIFKQKRNKDHNLYKRKNVEHANTSVFVCTKKEEGDVWCTKQLLEK